MVAYAPTEKTPEGQQAKFIAAINSTVASVLARHHYFGVTNANVSAGRRDEGGGGKDRKVMGAYCRGMLNEIGKLLMDFAENNSLALLKTFF